MLISLQEARDTLRLDGEDNDPIMLPLLEAIPAYLEVSTGRNWDTEPVHPLAQTVTKFILQLWFDGMDSESDRLKKTIDGLLTALTVIGRTLT